MKYLFIKTVYSTQINCSLFESGHGVKEYQVQIEINDIELIFEKQQECIEKSLIWLMKEKIKGCKCVFKRYFLSDIHNQFEELSRNRTDDCAISMVGQPPLNGTKVALWAYLQTDMNISKTNEGLFKAEHNGFCHLRSASNYSAALGSEMQSHLLLCNYKKQLEEIGCSLFNHCIRTWFFVQDVDNNYSGLVKARNEVFAKCGLTSQTHFISSTGIEGKSILSQSMVMMDTYAIRGIQQEQLRYLNASDYLSPTSIYGVSFERGTEITYGDRRHIFISGTASIDDKGQIVGEGRIEQQTLRMLENVKSLLREGGTTFSDIASAIVYLRGLTDYPFVKALLREKLPFLPIVFVYASVCRPEWLIEMECMAIAPEGDQRFKDL